MSPMQAEDNGLSYQLLQMSNCAGSILWRLSLYEKFGPLLRFRKYRKCPCKTSDIVVKLGYKSVAHYLIQTRQKPAKSNSEIKGAMSDNTEASKENEPKPEIIISEKTDESIVVSSTLNDGENMGKRRRQRSGLGLVYEIKGQNDNQVLITGREPQKLKCIPDRCFCGNKILNIRLESVGIALWRPPGGVSKNDTLLLSNFQDVHLGVLGFIKITTGEVLDDLLQVGYLLLLLISRRFISPSLPPSGFRCSIAEATLVFLRLPRRSAPAPISRRLYPNPKQTNKGHGEKQPSNDSYCDSKNGESRKAETNDASTVACEAVYIEEAPLCLEKEKDIFRKKSRHDSESPEIPEGPAKKKAKNDDEKKKVVRKDGDISKKDGSLLEVTQTIGTVVLTEKKKKHRDRTKTKGPCSDFPSEVKHKPQVEDRYQVRPDTDTDNQPVVCFAGPTEDVNTSLKKKKKCKRNASSEDPTTLRLTPTQSRKEGEEEFQGEKDTWSGSHEGGNTKKKRESDEKDIMSSCHEYNPKEAAITEMEAASSTYSNNGIKSSVLCKVFLGIAVELC
ncbi:hypothetical protein FCM35_KLT06448 [Carex littledalei]|uniref:Uncharacterized protein n=1 Tax=Carex littledalei TaxID=544730 RepID=A0A833QXM8_9POAL|nr:hypothetical protein FCM35_KLT06448 [Carex littledalei]